MAVPPNQGTIGVLWCPIPSSVLSVPPEGGEDSCYGDSAASLLGTVLASAHHWRTSPGSSLHWWLCPGHRET